MTYFSIVTQATGNSDERWINAVLSRNEARDEEWFTCKAVRSVKRYSGKCGKSLTAVK